MTEFRLATALAGLVLAWIVMFLFGAMEFDRGLFLLFRRSETDEVGLAARWLTEAGGALILLPVTLAVAAFLAWRRRLALSLLLLFLTLSGRLLVDVQKELTARVRPDPAGHLVPVESLSFPSAHAANSTMVWVTIALLVATTPRHRAWLVWSAVWLSLLIGTSRVVLGVHWPSDVIGGWAFGLFWTLLVLGLSERLGLAGTPSLFGHWREEEANMDDKNRRTETAQEHDDRELIENSREGPGGSGASGGNLQRDVGSRDEAGRVTDADGVTRVRASDKKEEANLPRFNQK